MHLLPTIGMNRRQNELRHFAQNWAFLRFTNLKRRKYSFSSPIPSIQCCADVRATYRKQQTPQLWMEGTGEGRGFFCSPKLPYLSTMWCLTNFVADFRYHLLNVTHLHITTVQILLPAFNFQRSIVEVAWWVRGAIISDHTKQHCRNKRWLLLKPELLWSHSHCFPIKWIEPSAKYILPRIQVFICLIYYYINILFYKGEKGSRGNKGLQGEKGSQGQKGVPGTCDTKVTITALEQFPDFHSLLP